MQSLRGTAPFLIDVSSPENESLFSNTRSASQPLFGGFISTRISEPFEALLSKGERVESEMKRELKRKKTQWDLENPGAASPGR